MAFKWDPIGLVIAAGMVYGAGIFLPLILGLIMKGFGSDTPIALVMTGYGYALTVFIPVTFVCIVP